MPNFRYKFILERKLKNWPPHKDWSEIAPTNEIAIGCFGTTIGERLDARRFEDGYDFRMEKYHMNAPYTLIEVIFVKALR